MTISPSSSVWKSSGFLNRVSAVRIGAGALLYMMADSTLLSPRPSPGTPPEAGWATGVPRAAGERLRLGPGALSYLIFVSRLHQSSQIALEGSTHPC